MRHIKNRFIRLLFIAFNRGLDSNQLAEFTECFQALQKHNTKLDELESMQHLATETNDMDWLEKVCNKFNQLEKV